MKFRLFLLLFSVISIFFTETGFCKWICRSSVQVQPEIDTETGHVLATWIVNNQAKILSCPEDGSSVSYKFKFGDRFFLADEEERVVNGKTWKLILANVGDKSVGDKYQAIGWIERENLQNNSFPLMDPGTSISIKAVAVKKSHDSPSSSIPLFWNPYLQGKPAATIGGRGNRSHINPRGVFYYVYRLSPDKTQRTLAGKIPDDTRSVLIGFLPALNSFNEHAGLGLLGWTSAKENLVFWRSRYALRLSDRTPLYHSRQGARNHDPSDLAGYAKGGPYQYNEIRSPVIKHQNGLYQVVYFDRTRNSQDAGSTVWLNSRGRTGNPAAIGHEMLVNQNDIMKLSALLYDLSSVTPSPRKIKRVWNKVIEEYTGDVCDADEKIQKCLSRSGAISSQQEIFEYTSNELAHHLAQTDIRRFKTLQCSLKLANKRIRALMGEKIYEFSKVPGDECIIKSRYLRDQQRWFKPESESILAWIPVKSAGFSNPMAEKDRAYWAANPFEAASRKKPVTSRKLEPGVHKPSQLTTEQMEGRLSNYCTDSRFKRRRYACYCKKIWFKNKKAYCSYAVNKPEYKRAFREFCGGFSATKAPPQGPSDGTQNRDPDLEMWRLVKDSNDTKLIKMYLQEFPQGKYKGAARVLLYKLKTNKTAD